MLDEEIQLLIDKLYESNYNPIIEDIDSLGESANYDFIEAVADGSISVLRSTINSLNSYKVKASALNITLSINVIKDALINRKNKEVAEAVSKSEKIVDGYLSEAELIIAREKKKAEEFNSKLVEDNKAYNSKFQELEAKREIINSYRDELMEVVNKYGFTSSDIPIDTESLDYDKLNKMYDEAIDYLKKSNRKSENPIRVFRDMFPDPIFQVVVLGVFILLSFTIILDFLAIFTFILIGYFYTRAASDDKYLVTIYGLINGVNPLDYCVELDKDKLIDVEGIDPDEIDEVASLIKECEEATKGFSPEEVEAKHDAIMNKFISSYASIESKFDYDLEKFNLSKSELIDEIELFVTQLNAEIETILSKQVKLGEQFSNSSIFDSRLLLGLKDGIEREYVDVGLSNVVINPSDDKEEMKRFIQVMLANALSNVKPRSMIVQVYDPNNSGRDVISFYDKDIENLFSICNTGSIEPILDDLKLYVTNNMKLFKDKSISEYNRESEQVGRTTKEYKLLLVLSQPKKIEEDEALVEFMSYSATYGVIVWVVTENSIKNTFEFIEPFKGVSSPYPIDVTSFGGKFSDTFKGVVNSSKSPALLWDDFTKNAIPDDTIWTYDCDEFVDIDPGYWEGDPTQYDGYTVGNVGDIHGIVVGGTGAGKSVYLNNLIANMTRKFSPKDLELWLVDFKGVEFIFYISETMLPHIKACLCTSDPDFSASLFKAIRKEAERRYTLLKEKGFKNMYSYNKWCRANGKEDETLKRIVSIIDEFQVIFEKGEVKVIEQIKADLTYLAKVARACGIHIIFASQSMKKTLSDDILQQFTLRTALRCDKEVSMSVMGTAYAGQITEANGYLYMRSVTDKSLAQQKKYRTPYISDDRLREHIKDCFDRANNIGFKRDNIITYQETTLHYVSEIKELYEANPGRLPETGGMFFGRKMVYDDNQAPENCIMTASNNTHICSYFSILEDMVMYTKSFIANLEAFPNSNYQLLFNSQVADLHYLCEFDKLGDDKTRLISDQTTDVKTFFAIVESIYESRKKSVEKLQPMYILLVGWDKAIGFGVDKDINFTNSIASMLQLCGAVDMHFVFVSSSSSGVPPSINRACDFLLAGRVDEATSFTVTESKMASKVLEDMESGYMFVNKKGNISKVKIYRSEISREITKNEIVL